MTQHYNADRPNGHTTARRADILGDELTKAIDAYAKAPDHRTLGDLSAALVGRCASMAASAVVELYERVAALEAARDGRD